MKFISGFFGLLLFCSCWGKRTKEVDLSIPVDGWRAVYSADTAVKKVTYFGTPRNMLHAGKIYVYGNRLFQNDIGRGIHILDNSNPAAVHRVAFLEIPGNTDFSIKGNFLYANNYSDLVVVNITDPAQPIEVKRLKKSFNAYDANNPYPWQAPPNAGFYECPKFDSDSIITGWVEGKVPQYCKR